MKRKLFIIVTTLLLTFSCSNDTDDKIVNNQTVVEEVDDTPKEDKDKDKDKDRDKDKDDEKEEEKPEPKDKELLIGTWSITKVYSKKGKLTATYKQVPVSMQLEITGKDYDMTLTFAEEKISNEGSFTAIAKISSFVINKTVEQKVKKLPSVDGKWEIKDKQIYVEGEEFPAIHFVKITKNETLVKIPLSKDLIDDDKLDAIEGVSNIDVSGDLFIELKRES